MPWYKVTKRINGRLYDYWQRTYRVGKSVKTENKYIGPAGSGSRSSSGTTHTATKFETVPLTTSQPPPPAAAQLAHENVMSHFDRYAGFSKEFRQLLKKADDKERREYEHDRYGPLKERIKRQQAAVRKAKRQTTGIKALNPFLALGIKPPK